MFLRLICIGLFLSTFSQIIYSAPLIESYQNNYPNNLEQSPLGNLFRYKAQIIDRIVNIIHQTFQNGFGVFSKNINNLGASFNSLIGATNRLIDDGFAAGRQYGMTIFQGVMIVPKSIADLVMAMTENNAYINVNAARSLSYVNGRPNYLFQFVDEQGRIIPVTASVANKLVPNINV